MVTYLTKQIVTSDLYIEPKDINSNLHQNIYNRLVQKVEGKSNHIGYVLKGSLEIVSKSPGTIIYINSINNVSYTLKYKCDILQPSVGEIIQCCIENITNAGVVAYVKFKDIIPDYPSDNTIQETPVVCIVPLNRFEDPSQLTRNQRIQVKVTAVRNRLNQSNIQIVGQPV